MRGIRSHKKRLLKKYKWYSEMAFSKDPEFAKFKVIGPDERRYMKIVIKHAMYRSPYLAKKEYRKNGKLPDISIRVYAMAILYWTMPDLLYNICAIKRISAKYINDKQHTRK